MAIELRIKPLLRRRGLRAGDLARLIDRTPSNLSVLMSGRAVAIRLDTLDAICRELGCQPGEILRWVPDDEQSVRDAADDGEDGGEESA